MRVPLDAAAGRADERLAKGVEYAVAEGQRLRFRLQTRRLG
jgi:hypothetical protein